MKQKYFPPTILNSDTLEGTGVVPLVIAGVTVKGAAMLLGGFLAGRAATKAMSARPALKLPSLTEGRRVE